MCESSKRHALQRAAVTAVFGAACVAGLMYLIADSHLSPIVSSLLGCAIGAGAMCLYFVVNVLLPIREVARATSKFDGGDLSPSVPETGPSSLRKIARTCNDLSADFQEVLLLFAHLSRSAGTAAEFIRAEGNSSHADAKADANASIDAVVEDIRQMQGMVMDFKYFRVEVDDDGITDVGVKNDYVSGLAPSGVAPDGASPTRVGGETDKHNATAAVVSARSMPGEVAGSGELS